MNQFNAAGMSLKDFLRPREIGEQVVSHVLENVREPAPDFEAMRLAVSPPQRTEDSANGRLERPISKDT